MKYYILILIIALASCKTIETNVPIDTAIEITESMRNNYGEVSRVFHDEERSYLTDYYMEQDNIDRIIGFFKHVNFKKFELTEDYQSTAVSGARMVDLYYTRIGSEFIIRFRYRFFVDTGTWKLIHLDWKSNIIEEKN